MILNAERIPVEHRYRGLRYVLDCVAKNYPNMPVLLTNVAALVDEVAGALAEQDERSALVHGLRLLDTAELLHLIDILDGKEIPNEH